MFFVKIACVIIFFIKIALALAYFNNVVFNKFSCDHEKYVQGESRPPFWKNLA